LEVTPRDIAKYGAYTGKVDRRATSRLIAKSRARNSSSISNFPYDLDNFKAEVLAIVIQIRLNTPSYQELYPTNSSLPDREFLSLNIESINTYGTLDEKVRLRDLIKKFDSVIPDSYKGSLLQEPSISSPTKGVVTTPPAKNNVDAEAEDVKPFIKNITLSMTAPVKEEENQILSVLKPLYTFIKKYNEDLPEEALDDFVLFEENDYRILKLLKEYGLIENASKPILIFGKKEYIKSRVYPTVKLSRPTAPFRGAYFPSKWDKYTEAFIELFGYKTGYRTSSFGEGIGPHRLPIENLVKKSKDPLVFMSNISNANVLDLSVDFSPYKAPLMGYGKESVWKLVDATLGTSGVIKDDSFRTGAVGVVLQTWLDQLNSSGATGASGLYQNSLESFRDPAVQKAFKNAGGFESLEEVDLSVNDFMEILLALGGKSSIKEKVSPGNTALAEVQAIKTLNKSIFRVSLKTLPFFNSTIIPGRHAVLYGKANNIEGATRLRDKFSQSVAFYTNTYQVVSVKHVITSDSAYSEFSLVKRDGDILSISDKTLKLVDLLKDPSDVTQDNLTATKTYFKDAAARKDRENNNLNPIYNRKK